MPQEFNGRTVDAEAPFLGAEVWKVGRKVRGAVTKILDTQNGRAYVLELEEPVEIDGEEWERASIGNMAGFKMAMQAARLESLRPHDILEIVCDGIKPAKKEGFSPRVNFVIKVVRP